MSYLRSIAVILTGLSLAGCQDAGAPAQPSMNNEDDGLPRLAKVQVDPNVAMAVGEFLQLSYTVPCPIMMDEQLTMDEQLLSIIEKHHVADWDDKSKCFFFTAVLLNTPYLDAHLAEIFVEKIYQCRVQDQLSSLWTALLKENPRRSQLRGGIDLIERCKPAMAEADKTREGQK